MTPPGDGSSQPTWDPDLNSDDGYKWKAFSAVGLSLVTMVMSFSIVFLALSSIADDFGVTLRAVSWVVIAQSLTVSAVMLPLGRVADLTGRKKFHLTGLVLFIVGSILSALSTSLTMLIVARVVMAVGSSMGQAVSAAIVTSVFPSHERGKGLGSQTTAVAIGASSGPIIAGLVLQILPWQVLFIFLVIPAIVAFVLGLFVLDDEKIGSFQAGQGAKYDWIGAGLSASGVIVAVLTINNPLNVAWTSGVIIGGGAAAIVLLSAFVWWELHVPAPMVDLRLFKNRVFRFAIATRYLAFMGTSATMFMMPVFLQSFRGISEAATGGIMFVMAFGMGIAAQTGGRLSDKFGYRRFTLLGFAILVATAFTFSTLDRDTPLWVIMPALFFNGIGMGLWSAPNMSATMGSVPRSAYGVVSAVANLTRNVGNVTGQAIVAAVISGVMVAHGFDIPLSQIDTTQGASEAFRSGWRIAYLAVVGFATAAGITAFLTREPDASTQEPQETTSADGTSSR